MMNPYPFFGFPPFRRPYPFYPNHPPLHSPNEISAANSCRPSNSSYQKQGNYNSPSSYFKQKEIQNCDTLKKEKANEQKEECFEIFGLKLYFDDLLLIALLFFLYQEEVKDTSLYIALVLLLLS